MNPWVKIGIALILASACFGAGWTIQGWHKDSEIAELKAEQATDRADVAEQAVDDLVEGTNKMKVAATELSGIKLNLSGKLDKISKELKDVQTKNPLPADCKPDDVRVLSLKAAIDAANNAAAGQ